MRTFFSRLLIWAQWIVGVVPRSARTSAILFRVVHYTAVVLITLLLGWKSDSILGWLLGPDWTPRTQFEFIRDHWCGVIFFLSYGCARLVIYLITLLRIEDEIEFPDITRAWHEALLALENQGLDCRSLPLFVVNGLAAEQELGFFQASRMQWKVVAPALERPSPLRFFANDDALFISCTNVGATSLQMRNTASPAGLPSGGRVLGTLTKEMVAGAGDVHGGTLPAGALSGGRWGTLRRIQGSFGTLRNILPGAGARATLRSAGAKGEVLVKLSPQDMDVCRRRMRFLCDLISAGRAPFCPINGFLQSLPLEWTEKGQDLGMLCTSVAADLAVPHEALGMRFPVSVFLPGLEQCVGFTDLMERCVKVDARFRDSRAGSRFPAGAPVDAHACEWVVDHGLDWLKGWVYEALARDLDSASNRSLYYLLCTLRQREGGLKSQLLQAFRFDSHEATGEPPARLSGWYLGAAGEASARQGFVGQLLGKLMNEQSEVAWSARTLRRNKLAGVVATIFFAVAAGLAVCDVYFALKGGDSPSDKLSGK